MTGRIILALLLVGVAGLPKAMAGVVRFESGLFHRLSVEKGTASLPEKEAIDSFFKDHYPALGDFEWRTETSLRDATHVHLLYALYYRGTRVVDRFLRVNYNRAGFIESAVSNWAAPFRADLSSLSGGARDRTSERLSSRFRSTFRVSGRSGAGLSSEPVVWIDPKSGAGHPALEVREAVPERLHFRHYFIDATTGERLEERKATRDDAEGETTAAPNSSVFLVSPLFANGALTGVELPSLSDTSSLRNGFIHVQRQAPQGQREASGSPRTSPVFFEIAPGDYSGGITIDATDDGGRDTYDYGCRDSSPDGCPNQAFDGVNVYYQLTAYRRRLDEYFKQLGVTASPLAATDPLSVVVNAASDPTDPSTISNNAAYVNHCSAQGGRPCLVFLRPGLYSDPAGLCRGILNDEVPVFDVAREAPVIVHEFQHYVTDSITRIVRGSSPRSVGDALHEGYSDYFGISFVTENAGLDPNFPPRMLAYSYQNCAIPGIVRDIGTLKVFENNDADRDEHYAGVTWASGLWALRGTLGAVKGDLLALKSQFFLSPFPDYVEAVEALVKADRALNAGAHVDEIRRLFYARLKFLGGKSGEFADPVTLRTNVGFTSCSGTSPGTGRWQSGLASLSLLAFWLFGTVCLGRRLERETR